jgi:hypothetical protein
MSICFSCWVFVEYVQQHALLLLLFLQRFPGLLPEDGAMPEVHIVAEPVAGMCDHFTMAEDEDEEEELESQKQQQQLPRVYLGIDVGECTRWFAKLLKRVPAPSC